MADTGLLAAPATAASARHSKVRTPPPPLGAYSSADDCTDSEAEADHRTREEDDGDGERGHRPQAQQPMCLTGRSNTNFANINNNNNVNNVINNNNNNSGGGGNSTRNKRKNFQPRNISYTQEDEAAAADGLLVDDRRGDGGSGTGACGDASGDDQSIASVAAAAAAAAGAVLDLSGPYTGGSTVAKRPRVDDGSAPMDLTCAVSQPPPPPPVTLLLPHADKRQPPAAVHGVQHLLQVAAAAAAAAGGGGGGGHHLQGVLHHHRPHQSADPSSDLKEYAQNTVRELLEIYGLNTDVADAITNNVPMVNFSTGKCRIDSIYCLSEEYLSEVTCLLRIYGG